MQACVPHTFAGVLQLISGVGTYSPEVRSALCIRSEARVRLGDDGGCIRRTDRQYQLSAADIPKHREGGAHIEASFGYVIFQQTTWSSNLGGHYRPAHCGLDWLHIIRPDHRSIAGVIILNRLPRGASLGSRVKMSIAAKKFLAVYPAGYFRLVASV